jgi:hypothetical protein
VSNGGQPLCVRIQLYVCILLAAALPRLLQLWRHAAVGLIQSATSPGGSPLTITLVPIGARRFASHHRTCANLCIVVASSQFKLAFMSRLQKVDSSYGCRATRLSPPAVQPVPSGQAKDAAMELVSIMMGLNRSNSFPSISVAAPLGAAALPHTGKLPLCLQPAMPMMRSSPLCLEASESQSDTSPEKSTDVPALTALVPLLAPELPKPAVEVPLMPAPELPKPAVGVPLMSTPLVPKPAAPVQPNALADVSEMLDMLGSRKAGKNNKAPTPNAQEEAAIVDAATTNSKGAKRKVESRVAKPKVAMPKAAAAAGGAKPKVAMPKAAAAAAGAKPKVAMPKAAAAAAGARVAKPATAAIAAAARVGCSKCRQAANGCARCTPKHSPSRCAPWVAMLLTLRSQGSTCPCTRRLRRSQVA